MKSENRTWEAAAILEMVANLREKIVGNGDIMYLSGSEYSNIESQLRELSGYIFDYNEMSSETKFRIDNLLDVMTNIAAGDFTEIPYQSPMGQSHFDAMAEGLKLMISELEPQWNELKKYELLFDSLNIPLILTTPANKIQRCNPLFQRVFVRSVDKIIGQDMSDFLMNNKFLNGNIIQARVHEDNPNMARYKLVPDPKFSLIRNNSGQVLGRVYSFSLEFQANQSKDSSLKRIEEEVLQYSEKIVKNVKSSIDKGAKNALDKEKLLLEIASTLEDKMQASPNKLRSYEKAWYDEIRRLTD